MTSRPVVTIISADGKASSNTHPLPNVFKAPIRPDIVQYEPFRKRKAKEERLTDEPLGMSTLAWPRTSASRTL